MSIILLCLFKLMLQADKSTIVGEAVTYIKSLEGTVQRLEKLKQERMLAQQAAVGAGSSSGAASSSAPPPPPPPAQAVAATRESVLADMVQRWNAQEALVAELKAAATAVVYGAGTASDGAVPAPAPALPPVPPRAPPLQTWSARNIVVCVAGDSAFINLCTPRHPGMLTRLFYVLERHQIHVVAATVSSSPTEKMFFIQARVSRSIDQTKRTRDITTTWWVSFAILMKWCLDPADQHGGAAAVHAPGEHDG